MWNTGLNDIGNCLSDDINIVDGEDKKLAVSVAAGKSANWKSVIFPWCSDGQEVRQKAFQVWSLKSGQIVCYLFQDYSDNKIYWSMDSDKNGSVYDPTQLWSNRKQLTSGTAAGAAPLDPYSAISIVIQNDKIWGMDSSSQNKLFETAFTQALNVTNTITGIIGKVAAL